MAPKNTLMSLTVCALALTTSCLKAAGSEWFEWPSVAPLPGSPLDLSDLNPEPAGVHGRVRVQDGHFVTGDGKALRFWGCNLSAAENFPDEAGALRAAKRLRQGGINIARLHHMDNPWSNTSGGSIWSPDTKGSLVLGAGQLDRLHRLVAALKAEGVYSNVNLKVSRTMSVEDGFDASISQAPAFQKRMDYFSRRLIQLQKDYARDLLTAKNPYTGLSLAEDPAVAVVEINNENSLLGMRTRDIGRGLETLPEPFRGELTQLWNQWLLKRYPNERTLRETWAIGATPLGTEAVGAGLTWRADAQPGNDVTVTPGTTAADVSFKVTRSDGVRWRSGIYLGGLNLAEGQTYTITFSARADRERPIQVMVGRDDPLWRTDKWRTRGLNTTIALTPEWKEFCFVINTHSVIDLGTRFAIHAGHALGEVALKDFSIRSGSASAGLARGQTPQYGSVPIPTDATPAQWNDWLTFLSDTEVAYVEEMRAYLKDELKVQAPIVCTQANYGGIAGLVREKASDFIDSHCYWQHPDFGGLTGAWDPRHYIVLNTPQLAEFSPRWFGELGAIALLRVKGKPFTVTELDHPAPSEYVCEMYPFLATFASLQDWDALFPFDSVGTSAAVDDSTIGTFFDQPHHPAKRSFAPFATRLFRSGSVAPLTGERELFVRGPVWNEANHLDVLWLRQQPGADLGFLTDRLSVSETLLGGSETTHVKKTTGTTPSPATVLKRTHGQVYVFDTPAAVALAGYVGGETLETRGLELRCKEFGLNFAALTAFSLDRKPLGESKRLLVTLVARAGNQGTTWNPERTSLGTEWGRGPTIAERVPAEVRVRSDVSRKVYALAPNGARAGELATTFKDGWLSFKTTEGPATLQFEVVE